MVLVVIREPRVRTVVTGLGCFPTGGHWTNWLTSGGGWNGRVSALVNGLTSGGLGSIPGISYVPGHSLSMNT